MTRTFSILFLFFLLISCGKGGGGDDDQQAQAMDITDPGISSVQTPAPPLAQTFEVKAKLIGFSASQEFKVREAFERIKRVVASNEFKTRILQKKYKGQKRFVDNNGLSNAQIYKKILDGAERFSSRKNNTMDLVLKTYYTNEKVIGYTMPGIPEIFLNRRYLDQFAVNEVAMNIFHEWLHKIGFGHSYESTPQRSHSVPYAVGYIVRSLANKYK